MPLFLSKPKKAVELSDTRRSSSALPDLRNLEPKKNDSLTTSGTRPGGGRYTANRRREEADGPGRAEERMLSVTPWSVNLMATFISDMPPTIRRSPSPHVAYLVDIARLRHCQDGPENAADERRVGAPIVGDCRMLTRSPPVSLRPQESTLIS